MLYGLNIIIDYWGISSKEFKEDYPDLYEGQVKLYFKTKKERDDYMKTFEVSVWNKYSPGHDCDGTMEITDYGTFSIWIRFKTWTENVKEIRMR